LDWLSDIGLGRRQLEAVEEFVDLLIDCKTVDREGVPVASRNWIVTGHSLGGGLAQAFSLKVRSKRMLHRMVPGRVELVTFNGFGALELTDGLKDVGQWESMTELNSNYFVTGDVVSQIGTHLGPTYEIPLPAGIKPGIARSHALMTIQTAVTAGGYPNFGGFAAAVPPANGALKFLKARIAPALEFLADIPVDSVNSWLESESVLRDAVALVRQRGSSASYDEEFLRYAVDVIDGFIDYLQRTSDSPFTQGVIAELKRIQARARTL
jgi:pimeloyl-ACP methyl ester carboxylesterase